MSLKKCTIRAAPVFGVKATAGASVALDGCEISAGGAGGISAEGTKTSVTAKGCVLRDNLGPGLDVDDAASVTVDGGRIEGNVEIQVRAVGGGSVTLRNVSVLRGPAFGVVADAGGLVLVEGGEVGAQKKSGLSARGEGSKLTVRRTDVHDCEETGIYVQRGAVLVVEDAVERKGNTPNK